MTKADIINWVSEELGIDRRTVGLVIESFMKCVKDALGRERSVFLRGFGTFSLKKRAARRHRISNSTQPYASRLARSLILNPRSLSWFSGKKIIENRPGVNLPLPLSGRGGF